MLGAGEAVLDAVLPADRKVVRAFVNGCWDLLHCGHINAFRQARDVAASLVQGDGSRVVLVVGIHPNEEIRRVKGGAFVTSEEEKECMLLACKFVDDVVHGIPYDEISPSLLDRSDILCDIACHGDDPVILPNGVGMYDAARRAGRYLEFRRTEGISTTHLIDRLLTITANVESAGSALGLGCCTVTASQIASFTTPRRDSVSTIQRQLVYIDGDFDMFHGGHVHVLQMARRYGTHLLVQHASMSIEGISGL